MKIIFFGDSITEGGRDTGNKYDLGSGYVKILEGKLRLLYPDCKFEILNCGVGGDRTDELLLRVGRDVVDENPDVVVLQIGVNDVWRRFTDGTGKTAEEFRANYQSLVKTIKETGARVILLEPYVLNMEDKKRFRPYLAEYNAQIRAIAEAEEVPLIPVDEIFTGVTQDTPPSKFSVDGVHPTHRGCRYLADLVIKELKKYLS